jgi:hypothetical protein
MYIYVYNAPKEVLRNVLRHSDKATCLSIAGFHSDKHSDCFFMYYVGT